jgi:hypothetical protein
VGDHVMYVRREDFPAAPPDSSPAPAPAVLPSPGR